MPYTLARHWRPLLCGVSMLVLATCSHEPVYAATSAVSGPSYPNVIATGGAAPVDLLGTAATASSAVRRGGDTMTGTLGAQVRLAGSTAGTAIDVNAMAVGSGTNGPSTAQTGIHVYLEKENWAFSSKTPAVGEIDGAYIFTRQGGAGSDSSGLLIDVQNTGLGFLSMTEMVSNVLDPVSNTIKDGMDIQEGILNEKSGDKIGAAYTMNYGTGSHGLLFQSNAGASWANFIHAQTVTGATMFDVNGDGSLVAAGSGTFGGKLTAAGFIVGGDSTNGSLDLGNLGNTQATPYLSFNGLGSSGNARIFNSGIGKLSFNAANGLMFEATTSGLYAAGTYTGSAFAMNKLDSNNAQPMLTSSSTSDGMALNTGLHLPAVLSTDRSDHAITSAVAGGLVDAEAKTARTAEATNAQGVSDAKALAATMLPVAGGAMKGSIAFPVDSTGAAPALSADSTHLGLQVSSSISAPGLVSTSTIKAPGFTYGGDTANGSLDLGNLATATATPYFNFNGFGTLSDFRLLNEADGQLAFISKGAKIASLGGSGWNSTYPSTNSGSETHSGGETHSGVETHSGGETHNGVMTLRGDTYAGNATFGNAMQGNGAGPTASFSQGWSLGWNATGGTGETDYINNRGGGAGGHYWYNTTPAAWNGANKPAPIMTLDSTGMLKPAGGLDVSTMVGSQSLSALVAQAQSAALGQALFAASNGYALRSMADRVSDNLALPEFFVAGDPDDTQAFLRMYAKATTLMSKGQNVNFVLPRLMRAATLPQLQVPRGIQASFTTPAGGSKLIVTGGSNGIDVQMVNASASLTAMLDTSAYTRIGIGDLEVAKASTAPAGFDAVRVAGVPNSSGGDLSATYLGRIIGGGVGFGGSTTNPWLNNVHLLDTNYYRIAGELFTATGPGNTAQMASGTGILIETTQSTSSNFSVDGEINEMIQNGGFAALQTRGHVEGLHVLSGTNIGTAYGAYLPAWLVSGSGANAVYSGVFGVYFSQTHFCNYLRAIYAEYPVNLQLDPSNYIRGMGDTTYAIAADATLPADTYDIHPKDGSANQGASYVAVDAINGVFTSVIGMQMDSENTLGGWSTGIRDVSKSIYGETAPQYLNGIKIAGNTFFAFGAPAIETDDTAVRSQIDNNNSVGNNGAPIFGRNVEHHGNQHNGAPLEDGCMNGICTHNLVEQFNNSVVSPYGAMTLGGTYHGLLDFKLAGSSTTDGSPDCRLEVFSPGSSNPTSGYQGVLNESCAGGHRFSGPLTAPSAQINGDISSTTKVSAPNVVTTSTVYDGGGIELGTQGGNLPFIDSHSAPAAPTGTATNDFDARFYGKGGVVGTSGQGGYSINGTLGLTLENGPLSATSGQFAGGVVAGGVIVDQSGVDFPVGSNPIVTVSNTQAGVDLMSSTGATVASVAVPFPTQPVNDQTFYIDGNVYVTALTATLPSGVTIAGFPTSFSYLTPLKFRYNANNKVWVPTL